MITIVDQVDLYLNDISEDEAKQVIYKLAMKFNWAGKEIFVKEKNNYSFDNITTQMN